MFNNRFIQVPDEVADDLIYRWPSTDIRTFTRIVVDADAQALFLTDGKVAGVFGPGTHPLDPGHTPFIGDFLDRLTGGGLYAAQIIFISTSEKPGRTFGGSIDDLYDPQSQLVVTLKTFGDYAIKITDPVKLVLNLIGNDDWDPQQEADLNDWVSSQILLVMRGFITDKVQNGHFPILGMSTKAREIAEQIVGDVNQELERYGLCVSKLGNFQINLSEEDAKTLKKISKARVMTELAGGDYETYARSEAMLGAAEGMANGAPISPLWMMGRGGMMGAMTQGTGEAPKAEAAKFCSQCGAGAAQDAKFCSQCGKGF